MNRFRHKTSRKNFRDKRLRGSRENFNTEWLPKGKRGYYDPEFGLTDELYCKAKIQSYLELFED